LAAYESLNNENLAYHSAREVELGVSGSDFSPEEKSAVIITCLHGSATAKQVVIGHEAFKGEESLFRPRTARTNQPINTKRGTFDYLV
jgi:hypothetical protein